MTTEAEKLLPHYVYVCYDAADWVLYIGCSKNVSNRIRQHAPNGWADNLRHVQAIGPLPFDDARDLERALIYRLAPLVNQEHNLVLTEHRTDEWAAQCAEARARERVAMQPAMRAAINRLPTFGLTSTA